MHLLHGVKSLAGTLTDPIGFDDPTIAWAQCWTPKNGNFMVAPESHNAIRDAHALAINI